MKTKIEIALDVSESSKNRVAAIEALNKSKASMRALCAVAKYETDYYVRTAAIEALSRFGYKEAVREIGSLLHNSHVGTAAARAIASIGGDDAISALCNACLHGAKDVRREAAYGLARIKKNPFTISYIAETLTSALTDESAEVREAAAYALGKMKAKEAKKPLEAALENEENPSVRRAIGMTLAML